MAAAHDRAVMEGARRALAKRAALLRGDAAKLSTTVNEQWGREVALVPHEAVVKLRTAALLEECAADVAGMAGAQ